MLKHIFASINLPWELKRHAIDLLFCIMEGVGSQNDHDASLDYSVNMPSLYASLQVILLPYRLLTGQDVVFGTCQPVTLCVYSFKLLVISHIIYNTL